MHSIARLLCVMFALSCAATGMARAETGYDLWLRYRPVEQQYRRQYAVSQVVAGTPSPTLDAAVRELQRGLSGMLGVAPAAARDVTADDALVIGTPASSPVVAGLNLPLKPLGGEGYMIRHVTAGGHRAVVIAANSDVGALYGAFAWLRLIQTRQPVADMESVPRTKLRVLDHWDNLDGTVERGYAGASIWNWHVLPGYVGPRITDYARANASIGINGAVLNNVNARAESLSPEYIEKAAAIADALRPYGIRVYLSVRWSAPVEISHLATADPLDPAVKAWWQAKTDEIYKAIPDFGGFLVKANSEGQPGPQDYHRTHADGANMIADVLKPHHGVVMWRAFVYANDPKLDRASAAYKEFVPLDGAFRDNVVLQVKNGPLDFQPREPFSPLFGAMPKTSIMMEFQVTKEYLGQQTHLVYLGPMYEEALKADTHEHGPGSTVARVIDGSLDHHAISGMAGVANIGNDTDWCGSVFNQANWYVFGRMAWDPEISARAVAGEWVRQTFTADPAFVTPVVDMMMASREAAVNYMTPLGLVLIMAHGHHMGPGPWDAIGPREDWKATYYHRADASGIGFDRTATGSDNAAQYREPAKTMFEDIARTPEEYLLYFHHVPWDYRMRSGRTLWEELVAHYRLGVDQVAAMQKTWAGLKAYVDTERFDKTAAFLSIQHREAVWWRDACLAYFVQFSKRPFPAGYAPKYPLAVYEAMPMFASPDP
ncbi:MAG TPA: alpha-glucuronidase family glycosyl hydrolase [Rhizomicrobium sp.]|nr:alpha-glucuronidase family glycosyl hydrolase [Rhizomicrobium sp.]